MAALILDEFYFPTKYEALWNETFNQTIDKVYGLLYTKTRYTSKNESLPGRRYEQTWMGWIKCGQMLPENIEELREA